MLAMSDINIQQFIPTFAAIGIPVAFLVPTYTGYDKSIMDATGPVRDLLRQSGIHDYDQQLQGPENKEIIKAFFVESYGVKETTASLYRPVTKKGDPRIWFSRLKEYCRPCNLLALVAIDQAIYVLNLSKTDISNSLKNNEGVYQLLKQAVEDESMVSVKLLNKLKGIHNQGFLKSITPGDPGVGDTLENALGIHRNNLQLPDYEGIELKTSRITRGGKKKAKTRSTLFSKVPDNGYTYRELLLNFGKTQVPRGQSSERLQLECTLQASKANSHNLKLDVNQDKDVLGIQYLDNSVFRTVSTWDMATLRETLKVKHRETFWIEAVSDYQDGIEYFRYEKVRHTKNPNASLLGPLISTDIITVDLLAYLKENGVCRDHGALFKIYPEDLPLLLGNPIEYDL